MATRRYKINPGEQQKDVVSEVGAAVNSDNIELTIDLSTTAVNSNGTTRGLTKAEVLEGLKHIENHILSNIWPPA